MTEFPKVIIGQQAITPHGLGVVTGYANAFPAQWIEVRNVHGVKCKFDVHNVELLDPRR
jgi:hypothetical protein